MANQCDVCGKKPMTGCNVSHAHNKTKRVFQPNLQNVRAVKNGTVQMSLKHISEPTRLC